MCMFQIFYGPIENVNFVHRLMLILLIWRPQMFVEWIKKIIKYMCAVLLQHHNTLYYNIIKADFNRTCTHILINYNDTKLCKAAHFQFNRLDSNDLAENHVLGARL